VQEPCSIGIRGKKSDVRQFFSLPNRGNGAVITPTRNRLIPDTIPGTELIVAISPTLTFTKKESRRYLKQRNKKCDHPMKFFSNIT
jgi:hypothetical protein